MSVMSDATRYKVARSDDPDALCCSKTNRAQSPRAAAAEADSERRVCCLKAISKAKAFVPYHNRARQSENAIACDGLQLWVPTNVGMGTLGH
ncbi:hypothetical protein PG999_005485 [Apiospora kogelbergensis]|uniref:Uncharacterized protein n=1 Tax=Apiospora kogelbergensis TaxID=1337665 RepID=A0AAW0R298_9PEZI